MSKTVKEVLEELANSCFKKGQELWDASSLEYIGGEIVPVRKAQLHLDALYKARYLGMLPEELDSGIVDIGVGSMPNSYEEGFNLAIQEMKGKLNG